MAEQQPFLDVGLATNPEPRCACVLLIDTSDSMMTVVEDIGDDLGYTVERDGKTYSAVSGGVTRIDKVNDGLRAYRDDLTADALASQRVEVSVITFGGSVRTVTPFVGAAEFEPPTLTARGDTPMGSAIERAIDAVADRKRQYKENGLHYFRPWVFFITDGEPTDEWRRAAERVHEGERDKSFAFFAVGVEGADFATLSRISVRKPLKLKGYSFREMFVWLSQSQRGVSRSTPGGEGQIKFDPLDGWASL